MATSPDFLRLAASASRALADVALDSLRDAVLVVDFRHKQAPVVLANSAATHCLRADGDTSPLIEVPLAQLLGAGSIATIEQAVLGLRESKDRESAKDRGSKDRESSNLRSHGPNESPTRSLLWKLPAGEQFIATDLKILPGSAAQPMVMLTFRPVNSTVTSVMNQLPFDLLILDTDLKVTYANAAAMHAGASLIPGGVLGCSALALAPTSALHPEVYAGALEGRLFRDEALAYTEPGSPTRWFEITVQPLRNGETIVGLTVLCIENTQRRAGFRAQAASEQRLLALTEHARDIITVADAEGRLQYVSGGVRNSLGYSSYERLSSSMFELMHPEDYPGVRAQYDQLVAGKIEHFSMEVRIRHKDGTYRWLESNYFSALDNPLIDGVVVNSRDITERKQAEFKLGQREEVFRLAADAVDGVVFEWDLGRGVVHRSRGVQEVLGIVPEDLDSTSEAWRERVHPRDFEQAKRAVGLALLHGRGWTVTYRIRDARGCYKSILERGLIQRNAAGDPVRCIGTCVDISEIRRLTYILAESQRTAKIGGWEYNFLTEEVAWTDELYRILEANPADPPPAPQAMKHQCTPESAERLVSAFRQARAGNGALDVEIEVMTFKGNRLWVRVIGHTEQLDGRLSRAYGSVQDIQAQKVQQLALENSTDWLKLSMNMAHMHAWRWEKERDTFEFTTLEGYLVRLPSVYPGMTKMMSKVHPKDQAGVRRAIEQAFEQRAEVREEFRLQGADGRYRSYASTARPLFDSTGAPFGMVGVIQDITLRRDSERRLRQSEEVLRTTTANTADTLFLLDTSLRVRFINRSVNNRLIEDLIGREVDVLIPEPARTRVLEKLRRILRTGETLTYEFESSDDGELRYFENHAVAVQEDGIGAGISISMRDITERKRLEQEILDVSGRERQSIGRDLHDGLGQELTGVALMLRGLATRIQSRCPDVVPNVNEVVSLVNQSIDTARSLARGLLPVRSETGGISFALRALAARGRDLYGMDVKFRDEVASEFELNETDASHLYRIAQEALTNTARHGRAAKVEIVLHGNAKSFMLSIADDGEGFKLPTTSTGMGLKIMKYRAGMIGAKFEVGANEPRGTVITVVSERPVPPRVQTAQAIPGDYNGGSQQRMGSISSNNAASFRGQRR
jgi:PAS domain S-box-containing protein